MQDKMNLSALNGEELPQTTNTLELTDSDLEQVSGATGTQRKGAPRGWGYGYGDGDGGHDGGWGYGGGWGHDGGWGYGGGWGHDGGWGYGYGYGHGC